MTAPHPQKPEHGRDHEIFQVKVARRLLEKFDREQIQRALESALLKLQSFGDISGE